MSPAMLSLQLRDIGIVRASAAEIDDMGRETRIPADDVPHACSDWIARYRAVKSIIERQDDGGFNRMFVGQCFSSRRHQFIEVTVELRLPPDDKFCGLGKCQPAHDKNELMWTSGKASA